MAGLGGCASPARHTQPAWCASPDDLSTAFELFDVDGDGLVSLADARAVLQRLRAPTEALSALVPEGGLSRAEFAALLAHGPQRVAASTDYV